MRRGAVTVRSTDKAGAVEYLADDGTVLAVGRATPSVTVPGYVSLLLPSRAGDRVLLRVPADWVAEMERLP